MKKRLILFFISIFILLASLRASYAVENSGKANIKKNENQNIKLEIVNPDIKLIQTTNEELEKRKIEAENRSSWGSFITALGSVISAILLIGGGLWTLYKYFEDKKDAELNKKNQQFIELSNRASSTNSLDKSNAISSLPLLIDHNKPNPKKFSGNFGEYFKCYHKQNPYTREAISIVFNALVHISQETLQEKSPEHSIIIGACSEALNEITRKSLNKNVSVITKSNDIRRVISAICLDDKKLIKTKFHKIDFTGASLRGLEILQSDLINSKLDYVDLSYASFIGSNFCRSSIQNAILQNSNFNSSDLSYCKLSGSNLRLCDFTSVNLYKVDFKNCTNIIDADFTDCIMDKKNYDFIRDEGVKKYIFIELKAANIHDAEFIYKLFPDLQNKHNIGILKADYKIYKESDKKSKEQFSTREIKNKLLSKKNPNFFDKLSGKPDELLFPKLGERDE